PVSETEVRAARAREHFGARHHGRLPIEDNGVILADHDRVPGLRANLEELVLDPEAVEPIAEVADGLVIREVGLLDPPLRLLANDAEERFEVALLVPNRELGLVHGA